MKYKTLLFVFLSMIGYKAVAYDIAVQNEDGVTICYNWINNKTELSVVSRYGLDESSYFGNISIPEAISYDGNYYRVTSIGNYAFSECPYLTSVNIPNSVTTIGDHAFQNCSGLTAMKIPNNVSNINSYAFSGCTNLKKMTISNGVNNIGKNAFYNCPKLFVIIWLCTTPPSGYDNCGINYATNYVPNNNFSSFINPIVYNSLYEKDGITYIIENLSNNDCMLIYCDRINDINDIIIPSQTTLENKTYFVTKIGSFAFHGCPNLTSVKIPNSVTSINAFSFYECSNLISVIVDSNNTVYDSRNNCNAIIESLTNKLVFGCQTTIIPSGITLIGNYAFSGCSNLMSVNIPNSVTSIGNYAFENCSNLNTVSIPNSVKTIGNYAFQNCNNLTSVIINNNSLLSKSYTSTSSINAIFGPQVKSYIIGEEVKSIGNYAFYNTHIKSLTIGAGVLSIGSSAFGFDSSLGAKPIKTIWLANTPPSNYTLAEGVINYVSNDQYTSLNNRKVYPFLSSIFEIDGAKYVPISPSEKTCDVLDCQYNEMAEKIAITPIVSYRGVNMTIKSINPYSFYENNTIKEVELDFDGDTGARAFYGCESLETAKVCNSGIIDEKAFAECTSLETCTLGEEITSINKSSYENCTNLQQIYIPNSVEIIGDRAFYGCNSMHSTIIGNGVKTISQYAFSDCTSLTYVQIGNQVNLINNYAFQNCSALPKLEIPASAISIGNYTFSGCSSLATVLIADRERDLNLGSNGSNPLFSSCPLDSVYIGGNISYNTSSSYGYSPFYRNTSLRTIHITDKETEISPNEFYGCTSLRNVRIGDGVTTIGNWAFSGCSCLDYFAFGSKVEAIGQEAFSDCINVTKIISRASTPPTCGTQALDDINKWNCELIVPQNSLTAYQEANQWKEFFFINGLTEDNPKAGDANGDGLVDVSDIALVINYILGRNLGSFSFIAADMNKDGEIDISDFAAVVNIILHSGQANMMSTRQITDDEVIIIDMPDLETQAGETVIQPINMKNSTTVSSFQLDIHLPKGVTLMDIIAENDRSLNHLVDWNMMNDDVARVLYFSTDNSPIRDDHGTVLNLSINVNKDIAIGDYYLNARHIILSSDGNRMTAEDVTATMHVNDATGIDEQSLANENEQQFFGIDGIQLNKPRRGINIIRDRDRKTIKILRNK